MNRMRLLLIEDEESAVQVMKRLLGPFASIIHSTPRIATARQMLTSHDYDVIILDLSLLDSDREQTIEAIPELRRLSSAPVIVATGWPSEDIRQQCLNAGAAAFVAKNEMSQTVLMAVQVALEGCPQKDREPSFPEHVALLQRILKIA